MVTFESPTLYVDINAYNTDSVMHANQLFKMDNGIILAPSLLNANFQTFEHETAKIVLETQRKTCSCNLEKLQLLFILTLYFNIEIFVAVFYTLKLK